MAETTPQSTPIVTGMDQPGPQAAAPSTMESVAPPNLTQAGAPAYGEPGAATQPSTTVPAGAPAAQPAAPPPHAKLLAMVQGLSEGLSAAATSISTHGREGGAAQVQEMRQSRAAAQQRAMAATQAQKDAETRNKLMTAQTNEINTKNIFNNATLPDEIAKSHLQVSGEKQTQAITGADFQAAHGGMKPEEFSKQLDNTTPLTEQGNSVNPFFLNQGQSVLRAAQTANIPPTNPAVKNLTDVLADPKATAKAVYMATTQMQAEQDRQAKATEQRTKQETAEAGGIVGKLSTPEALAAPGAQAAIQARIDDPNTSVADVTRLRTLLPQAAVAQLNAENIKAREARNQQLVNQGTPETAGRLLADRSLTLTELKSRQVTPKFIADAIVAAQKFDPTYKAAEAEAQGRIAASPANSQFFGNTDSLLVRGGTLDQLGAAYKALGNTEIPVINKLDNLRKAAVGSGPLAAAYAAQLGVADDYSKVMSGGTGSDTSRQQALDIMSVNLSPEARDAAINQIRSAVTSQRNGRVGTNPYMKDMYPDPSRRQETPGQSGTQSAAPRTPPTGVPAGSKLMQVPGGQPHWISPDKIPAAQKLGATEVQ